MQNADSKYTYSEVYVEDLEESLAEANKEIEELVAEYKELSDYTGEIEDELMLKNRYLESIMKTLMNERRYGPHIGAPGTELFSERMIAELVEMPEEAAGGFMPYADERSEAMAKEVKSYGKPKASASVRSDVFIDYSGMRKDSTAEKEARKAFGGRETR